MVGAARKARKRTLSPSPCGSEKALKEKQKPGVKSTQGVRITIGGCVSKAWFHLGYQVQDGRYGFQVRHFVGPRMIPGVLRCRSTLILCGVQKHRVAAIKQQISEAFLSPVTCDRSPAFQLCIVLSTFPTIRCAHVYICKCAVLNVLPVYRVGISTCIRSFVYVLVCTHAFMLVPTANLLDTY